MTATPVLFQVHVSAWHGFYTWVVRREEQEGDSPTQPSNDVRRKILLSAGKTESGRPSVDAVAETLWCTSVMALVTQRFQTTTR